MIKEVLIAGAIIGGLAIGGVKLVQTLNGIRRENERIIRQKVEISNYFITLSFEKKDISYKKCETHGSDLVISGIANDGIPLAVSIFDSPNCVRDGLYALLMDEEGESRRIRFPQGNFRVATGYHVHTNAPIMYVGRIPGETYFTDNVRFGAKRADRITVLED